jgi:hypothetical protein
MDRNRGGKHMASSKMVKNDTAATSIGKIDALLAPLSDVSRRRILEAIKIHGSAVPFPDVRPEFRQVREAAVNLVALMERANLDNWVCAKLIEGIPNDNGPYHIRQRDRFNAMQATLRDFIRWLDIRHNKKGPKTDFHIFVMMVAVIIEEDTGRPIEWVNHKKDPRKGSPAALLWDICKAIDPTVGAYTVQGALKTFGSWRASARLASGN